MKMISGFFYLTGFALLGASTLVCAMNPELIPATFNVDSDAWLESITITVCITTFLLFVHGVRSYFLTKGKCKPF